MMDHPGLNIVLIDDDDDVRRTLGAHLTGQGHDTRVADSGERGISLLQEQSADVVITDMMMPGMTGMQVLQHVTATHPDTEVVVITAFGDVERAVQAMHNGAFDYFTKPYEVHAISACLQRTARFRALRNENERYRRRLAAAGESGRRLHGLNSLIGASAAMQDVRERIQQVATAPDTTVLITGETGTGKELVARAIHFESDRASGPLIPVDCTAIPAGLAESDLFGHVQGAFTDARQDRAGLFEKADGGTLFLDEIGDMSMELQARLLRVLEERQVRRVGGDTLIDVDVRVVSATHRDLRAAAEEGRFREDLLYRLQTFTIQIQPLRDRREDVFVLAQHFFEEFRRDLRRDIEGLDESAIQALAEHGFPGNVRELRNATERAVIRCRARQISATDLDLWSGASDEAAEERPGTSAPAIPTTDPIDLDLVRTEERLVKAALERAGGNRTEAARLLGISRDALRRRLRRLGVATDEQAFL